MVLQLLSFSVLLALSIPQSGNVQIESPTPPVKNAAPGQLIPLLLGEEQQLRGVSFSEVIFNTTGKKVLPFDGNNVVDRRVAKAIGTACDETMKRFNAPNTVISRNGGIDRINEVSGHFEDMLRELLKATPGLQCDFSLTAEGKVQRSGYPDLRIIDLQSKRVFYLDPKLYAAGSRDSSFRAFYFEPKKATNKVHDDAVHFVVGFEHSPREGGSASPSARRSSPEAPRAMWKFTRWDLVDLSRFTVKLKAEFQGSNRDMYRPETIVATSAE